MNNLPDIEFVSSDVGGIEESIIATYEGIAGVTLYKGDPVRKFLESLAVIISQQRFLIDFSAKQNLLAYAEGDYLDYLAERMFVNRLPAQPATVRIRFDIASPLDFPIVVNQGIRVTPDRKLFFATDETVQIEAGNTSVEVTATCQVAGVAGNGFVAGQIVSLVDTIPYITGIINTTTSEGGTDAESDDNLKERYRLAPLSFSVAGPEGAYKYWARSAHQEIADISVTSSAAGTVMIKPLMSGGQLPSQSVLDAVADVFANDNVRPLTDYVVVSSPTSVIYNIDLTYYIARSNAALADSIATAAEAAVADYILWQSEKLGRDVDPSELIARVKAAGVKRVVVTEPVFTTVDAGAVAIVGSQVVTNGGLEDD